MARQPPGVRPSRSVFFLFSCVLLCVAVAVVASELPSVTSVVGTTYDDDVVIKAYEDVTVTGATFVGLVNARETGKALAASSPSVRRLTFRNCVFNRDVKVTSNFNAPKGNIAVAMVFENNTFNDADLVLDAGILSDDDDYDVTNSYNVTIARNTFTKTDGKFAFQILDRVQYHHSLVRVEDNVFVSSSVREATGFRIDHKTLSFNSRDSDIPPVAYSTSDGHVLHVRGNRMTVTPTGTCLGSVSGMEIMNSADYIDVSDNFVSIKEIDCEATASQTSFRAITSVGGLKVWHAAAFSRNTIELESRGKRCTGISLEGTTEGYLGLTFEDSAASIRCMYGSVFAYQSGNRLMPTVHLPTWHALRTGITLQNDDVVFRTGDISAEARRLDGPTYNVLRLSNITLDASGSSAGTAHLLRIDSLSVVHVAIANSRLTAVDMGGCEGDVAIFVSDHGLGQFGQNMTASFSMRDVALNASHSATANCGGNVKRLMLARVKAVVSPFPVRFSRCNTYTARFGSILHVFFVDSATAPAFLWEESFIRADAVLSESASWIFDGPGKFSTQAVYSDTVTIWGTPGSLFPSISVPLVRFRDIDAIASFDGSVRVADAGGVEYVFDRSTFNMTTALCGSHSNYVVLMEDTVNARENFTVVDSTLAITVEKRPSKSCNKYGARGTTLVFIKDATDFGTVLVQRSHLLVLGGNNQFIFQFDKPTKMVALRVVEGSVLRGETDMEGAAATVAFWDEVRGDVIIENSELIAAGNGTTRVLGTHKYFHGTIAVTNAKLKALTRASDCGVYAAVVIQVNDGNKAYTVTLAVERSELAVIVASPASCTQTTQIPWGRLLVLRKNGIGDVNITRSILSMDASQDGLAAVFDAFHKGTVRLHNNAFFNRADYKEKDIWRRNGFVFYIDDNSYPRFEYVAALPWSVAWVYGGPSPCIAAAHGFDDVRVSITAPPPSLDDLDQQWPQLRPYVDQFLSSLPAEENATIVDLMVKGQGPIADMSSRATYLLAGGLATLVAMDDDTKQENFHLFIDTAASIRLSRLATKPVGAVALVRHRHTMSNGNVSIIIRRANIVCKVNGFMKLLVFQEKKYGQFVIDFQDVTVDLRHVAPLAFASYDTNGLFLTLQGDIRHLDENAGRSYLRLFNVTANMETHNQQSILEIKYGSELKLKRFDTRIEHSRFTYVSHDHCYMQAYVEGFKFYINGDETTPITIHDTDLDVRTSKSTGCMTTVNGIQVAALRIRLDGDVNNEDERMSMTVSKSRIYVEAHTGQDVWILDYIEGANVMMRDSVVRSVARDPNFNSAAPKSRIFDINGELQQVELKFVRVDMSNSTAVRTGPCFGGDSRPNSMRKVVLGFYNNTFGDCDHGLFYEDDDASRLDFDEGDPLTMRCNYDTVRGRLATKEDYAAATVFQGCDAPCDIKTECNVEYTVALSPGSAAPGNCGCLCRNVTGRRLAFDFRCDPHLVGGPEVPPPPPTPPPMPSITASPTFTATRIVPPSATRILTATLAMPVTSTVARTPSVLPLVMPATRTVPVSTPAPTTTEAPTTSPAPTPAPTPSTATMSLPLPTPAPTEAPLVKRAAAKSDAVGNVMSSALPASAAAGVAATGNSAVAVGGAVNPSAANKGANLANIVGTVDCSFSEDSLEVSEMEVFVLAPIGESEFRHLAGGAAVSLAFVYGAMIMQFILFKVARHAGTLRRYVAAFSSMLIAYMMPNVASYSMTMAVHGTTRDVQGIAALGFTLLIVSYVGPLYIILTRMSGLVAVEDIDTQLDDFMYPFLVLTDGCRDTTAVMLRTLFFEDMLVAIVMGLIGGWQPVDVSCTVVAMFLIVAALLHVLYVLKYRPFRERVDSVFAVVIALGQLALAIVTLVVIITRQGMVVLGYLALAMGISFMLQALCTGGWAIVVYLRRRAAKKLAALKKRDSEVTQALTLPILGEGEVLGTAAERRSISNDDGDRKKGSSSGAMSSDGEDIAAKPVNPLAQPKRAVRPPSPPPPPPEEDADL